MKRLAAKKTLAIDKRIQSGTSMTMARRDVITTAGSLKLFSGSKAWRDWKNPSQPWCVSIRRGLPAREGIVERGFIARMGSYSTRSTGRSSFAVKSFLPASSMLCRRAKKDVRQSLAKPDLTRKVFVPAFLSSRIDNRILYNGKTEGREDSRVRESPDSAEMVSLRRCRIGDK
jgi:hypothetical protein